MPCVYRKYINDNALYEYSFNKFHVIRKQHRVAFAMNYDDVRLGLLATNYSHCKHRLICAPLRLSHCNLKASLAKAGDKKNWPMI